MISLGGTSQGNIQTGGGAILQHNIYSDSDVDQTVKEKSDLVSKMTVSKTSNMKASDRAI